MLAAEVSKPRKRTVRTLGREGESLSLQAYLGEVYQVPLLSREDELELAHKVAEGDSLAGHRLAQSNLRLVVSMARKYLGTGMNFQDLIQEGNLGLLEAVSKFDASKGCRFSTYACWWIRQSITRALANKSRTIRLPVHINEVVHKYSRISSRALSAGREKDVLGLASRELFPVTSDKVCRKMSRKLRRKVQENDPSVTERIRQLELEAVRRLQVLLSIAQEPVSLETPLGSDPGHDLCLGDTVPAPQADLAASMTAEDWRWLLSHLSDREAAILRKRFGLAEEDTRTLNELAEEMGVSREAIRQQEVKALKKLRTLLEKEGWARSAQA